MVVKRKWIVFPMAEISYVNSLLFIFSWNLMVEATSWYQWFQMGMYEKVWWNLIKCIIWQQSAMRLSNCIRSNNITFSLSCKLETVLDPCGSMTSQKVTKWKLPDWTVTLGYLSFRKQDFGQLYYPLFGEVCSSQKSLSYLSYTITTIFGFLFPLSIVVMWILFSFI